METEGDVVPVRRGARRVAHGFAVRTGEPVAPSVGFPRVLEVGDELTGLCKVFHVLMLRL
jgi:hypothetical protein